MLKYFPHTRLLAQMGWHIVDSHHLPAGIRAGGAHACTTTTISHQLSAD